MQSGCFDGRAGRHRHRQWLVRRTGSVAKCAPAQGCPCDRAGAVGRANAGRTLWLGNVLDDYWTESTCSGTRLRYADGDGIGDLVELYRNQILNGLYTVDTDNNGINDRNPVVGP